MAARQIGLWALILTAGSAAGLLGGPAPLFPQECEEEEGLEMGPPPPGYWRITGDAVPGWVPADVNKPVTDGPIMWSRLGPRPIRNEYWSGNANASGRVVSITPHPTDPNVVYIGSASGGVWKTTDGGLNWSPISDELSNLNIGWVTLDPGNPQTVYAGTGEYWTSSGGDGLFRSPDGGVNWTRIATTSQVGANITKVLVDPTNSQVIHVTGTSGYARSTDGGTTWTTRLNGTCTDLAVNSTNPQTVFVGRANDGVYRSVDGGQTFTRLTGGLPAATGVRVVVLSMSRSNPNVVYTAMTNSSSGLLGMFKTTDGGNTWTNLPNTPDFPSPQGWYDVCVGVDPTNENVCYGGGVFPSYAVAGVIKTTDGGNSWTDISVRPGGQVHPDMHVIAFGPGTLWVGSDGGVWKSTNAGSSWVNCNATLEVTQLYALSLDPTNPAKMAGGTQDNGSVARDLSTEAWPQTVAGDGGFCAVDFVTPTRRYFTYVYLTVYRQNGTTTTEITGPWASDPANFIAPLVMDPNNSQTLLGGTNRVWRTTNAATTASWTAISTSAVGGGGNLNVIAVAQGASNTIYTGSTTGKVFVTTNASTWNDRSAGLPAAQVSDILISPTDPGTAYVSFTTTAGARVLRTSNYGQTWTNATGALPSGVRAKALEVDWRFNPPDLYVGTGAGVYWSFDGGQTWTKDGADLPNVNIGDLQIDRARNTITAGTYGRGAWRANLRTVNACYANCDGSTTAPVLNINDFVCFQSKFAAGDPSANCDGSTTVPVLNINDFICFQQQFAAGCP